MESVVCHCNSPLGERVVRLRHRGAASRSRRSVQIKFPTIQHAVVQQCPVCASRFKNVRRRAGRQERDVVVVISLIMVVTMVTVRKIVVYEIAGVIVGMAVFFGLAPVISDDLRHHEGVMGNHSQIRSLNNAHHQNDDEYKPETTCEISSRSARSPRRHSQ